MSKKVKSWVEAMRLRTLPVSLAGVVAGCGCAAYYDKFSIVPAILCLLFALFSQIASNFANEYFDFKNGLDKKGRAGFRRGVTEGDINPKSMKFATLLMLTLACLVGLAMLMYGGWWLIGVGVAVVIFALAYSAGPYPLSHHGLGDVAVVIFFGIVPVTLTCYLQMGDWTGIMMSLPISIAVGLLAANVLVVNNYRDMDDDKAVGKRTTVVIFGRKVMGVAYLLFGVLAMAVMTEVWCKLPWLFSITILLVYLIPHSVLWRGIVRKQGSELNPMLGKTAMLLFAFTVILTLSLWINHL